MIAAAKPLDERGIRSMAVGEPALPAVSKEAVVEDFHLTPEEERLLFEAAGRRLIAEVLGDIPAPLEQSLAGLAMKRVDGVFVTLKRSGALRSCCGSVGEAIPLCETIERAVVAAAKHDRRFPPISPGELPYLDVHVTLLGNMKPIAARGAERRNAVLVGKHGLMIAHSNKQGLLLPVVAVEHGLDAEGFLELVCRKAGLGVDAWRDDNAVLTTFEGRVIEGNLKRLWAGDVRMPAHAGMFYPRSAGEIKRTLDGWLQRHSEPESWSGALVPHAGWIYSGRLGRERFQPREVPQAGNHPRPEAPP